MLVFIQQRDFAEASWGGIAVTSSLFHHKQIFYRF